MKPRLRPYLRLMRPSQRRALGSLLAVLIVSLLYSGSYAVLRLSGYLVRGSSADFGGCMYAGSSSTGGATYYDGSVRTWNKRTGDHLPHHTLRLFTPMIRIELALRNVISEIR